MARVPRLRDVAERAGLSRSLVSSYLNTPDLVSVTSQKRIQAAIDELGFVRNEAARQLRHGSSQVVSFVAFDISDPLFVSVVRGARQAAAENGLSLVLADTAGQAETEKQYLRVFEEQRVHGILFSPAGDTWDYLRQLESRRIPTVLIDHASPSTRWSAVTVNDVLGGELAVGHLLDIGRRRIAVVGGPSSISQIADRIRGAHNAIARAGDATLTVIETSDRTVATGRELATVISECAAEERPDGIFCINDQIASGLIFGLRSAGIDVPHDIGVIGYNDTSADALTTVPLSSIRQPHEQFGRIAIELLLEAIAAPPEQPRRQVLLDPELVVRASTRQ